MTHEEKAVYQRIYCKLIICDIFAETFSDISKSLRFWWPSKCTKWVHQWMSILCRTFDKFRACSFLRKSPNFNPHTLLLFSLNIKATNENFSCFWSTRYEIECRNLDIVKPRKWYFAWSTLGLLKRYNRPFEVLSKPFLVGFFHINFQVIYFSKQIPDK